MRTGCACVLIFAFTSVGVFLAAGYGTDDRCEWWQRRHVEIIQGQLAEIKQHLLEYRKAHGRYPTNDEGLAVIDDFESRFKVWFKKSVSMDPEQVLDYEPNSPGGFWERTKQVLPLFRERQGHAPANAQELEDFGLWGSFSSPWGSRDPGVEVELGLSKDDSLLILSPQGILSPWLLPYVYENRNGFDAAAFKHSPVDRDPEQRYSVRVDDGVYVYSVGAMEYSERLGGPWNTRTIVQLFGLALIVGAVVLAFLAIRAAERRVLASFFTLAAMVLSALLGLGYHSTFWSTCYMMSPFFSRRNPEMVSQQKDLLEKYRAAGVINEETYRKSLAAVEPAKAQVPPQTKP
ncbi:MAG: hypothetical protein NT049_04630 [Planctomycetota bacterium]|nr:hypothetical protein [Planctomycetota bacterium]